MKRLYFYTIICFLFFSLTFGQNSEKVLFVGNSFTYYWNLPIVVEEMAKSTNTNLEVYQSTLGGATLKQHWNGERNLTTRELLAANEYDKVILQDHSTYPLTKTDTSLAYFKKFIHQIRSKEVASDIYLYSTWMYPQLEEKEYDTPYPIETIMNSLASETNSNLLPVGRAFKIFRDKYPNIPVFMEDDKHSTHNGAYLAACVIYGKLTGKSPVGLPHYFKSDEEKGKKAIYYIILRKNIAELCQAVAAQALGLSE